MTGPEIGHNIFHTQYPCTKQSVMTEKIFKNFPFDKSFPTTNNSWYLYDARANLFLILSDAEKYIICEYMTLCTGSDENIKPIY